jgi:protein-S-isoprenylcysteine O-methyltransferase Ste14
MFGLVYAVISYLVFLGTFLHAFGFVEGWAVPRPIDAGTAGPLGLALAIDVGWFVLFAVQHSGMARADFKRRWLPPPLERSTYVLVSSLLLALLMVIWQSIPTPIWRIASPIGRNVMIGLSLGGWLLLLVSTFLYDHFELFGLRQAWMRWRGTTAVPTKFRTPGLYNYVRHPMYLGFLIAFWATPELTVGHAVFAGGFTAYVLTGIYFEERDLLKTFGDEYRAYQKRVPMLIPGWPR